MSKRRPFSIIVGILGIVLAFVNYDVMDFSLLLLAASLLPGIVCIIAEKMLMSDDLETVKRNRTDESDSDTASEVVEKSFLTRFEEKTGLCRFLECVGSHYILIVLTQPLFAFIPKLWAAPYPFVQGLIRFFYSMGIAYVVGFMIDRAVGLVMMGAGQDEAENMSESEGNNVTTLKTAGIFLPLPSGYGKLAFFLYNVFYLGIYCIMQFSRTRAYDLIPNAGDIWGITLGLALAFSVFLFGVNYRTMENRILANLLIPATLLVFISYNTFQYSTICAPYILAMGAIGLSERGLIKNSLIISIYTVAASFLLSMSGVIENSISRAADGFKHTYGFGNPNWISIQLAVIVIMYLFLRNREKILGMILDLGIIAAVIYFIRYSTGGRTSVIGLAVVLAGTLVCDICHLIPYKLRQQYNKAVAIFNFVLTEAVLFGSAAISLYLSWTYNEDYQSGIMKLVGRVFNTKSFNARLDSAHRGLIDYSPKLFGQIVHEVNSAAAAETGEEFFWLDVFYVRLLLTYGIVMFICFFVFYTVLNYRLAKKGRFYQMYLLMALPVMGVTEALVGDLMYNIFPVVAFSKMQEKSDYDTRKEGDFFGVSLAPPIALAFLAPALLYVLSWMRTVVNGYSLGGTNAFYLVTGILLFALFIIASTSGAITAFWQEKKVTLTGIFVVCRSIMLLVIAMAGGVLFLGNLKDSNIARISEAESIIRAISSSSDGETYVDNVPEVYDQQYTGINKPFFYGDELAFFEDIALVTDINSDYKAYFDRGFVYTALTEYDALYTNDDSVISAMEARGHSFQGFCSYLRHVNLPYEIDRNGLETSAHGGALLDGPEQSLTKGPYSETKPGTYTVTYDLYIDPLEYDEDYLVCTLLAQGGYGEKILNKKEIYRSDFDEEGHLSASMNFNGNGAGTEFHALMEDGREMEIRDISFVRSSAYDKRVVTDARGNVTHEEYLDDAGNPFKQSGGFYGSDYEYDEEDRLIHRTYLDENGEPVMIKDGYSQYYVEYGPKRSYRAYTYFDLEGKPVLRKKSYHKDLMEYDEKGRVVKESYYGTDGKLIMVSDGYAAMEKGYDEDGNVNSIVYLGTDLEPVIMKSGYAQIKKVFNDKKQVIREEYYDESGKRMALSGGKSAVEKKYDELGCVAEESYFGINDEKILLDDKYHKLVRRYNDKKKNVHEEYYGTDDKLITVSDGYAGIDRKYNEDGNVIRFTYLGLDLKPVITESGYANLHRDYNDQNKRIRDAYYDTADQPMELSGGQHAVEFEYDENGNICSYAYFNMNNEPILLSGKYFKDFRYFNDDKKMIRREYYGLDGQPVEINKGYFAIEYFYDESGTWSERNYYNIAGELVTSEKNEK